LGDLVRQSLLVRTNGEEELRDRPAPLGKVNEHPQLSIYTKIEQLIAA
jgi:hypothetical protein